MMIRRQVVRKSSTQELSAYHHTSTPRFTATVIQGLPGKCTGWPINCTIKCVRDISANKELSNTQIVQIHSETETVLSVSSLLLDDTFQPVTPLSDGAVNEARRQFATLRDDCTLELLDCSESSMSITQKRMIPKCSNLVQRMTLGYPRSEMVLGVSRSQVRVRVTWYSKTAWVRTHTQNATLRSSFIGLSLCTARKQNEQTCI